MRSRLLARALIQILFLISTLAIFIGAASAQEIQYFVNVSSPTSNVNRTHITVGDINREQYSNIHPNSESFNRQVQDVNRTHIYVGDINRGIDTNKVRFGETFKLPEQNVNRTHIYVGDISRPPK